MISSSFGLLAENLEIDITKVNYEFGYKIGFYEGNYSVTMKLNEEEYGIFLYFEESRVYQIEVPN
jgi:hypothetical protein